MSSLSSPDPLSRWMEQDRNEETPTEEVVTLAFILKGEDARVLMNEAIRRGVKYDDVAKIFCIEGISYWRRENDG